MILTHMGRVYFVLFLAIQVYNHSVLLITKFNFKISWNFFQRIYFNMNFSFILTLLSIFQYIDCIQTKSVRKQSSADQHQPIKTEESEYMTIRDMKIPNQIPDWDRRSPLEKFTTKLNEMISKNSIIRRKFICLKFKNCQQINKAIFMLNQPPYRMP